MTTVLPVFLLIIFIVVVTLVVVVTKNIRGKISQLSYQNRLFKALRELDIVAFSTTNIELLTQAIVDVVHNQLGYTVAVIAFPDYEKRIIKRMAISRSKETEEAFKNLISVKFSDQILSFAEDRNLLNKVLVQRKSFYTTNLFDVQVGVLPEEISKKIQQFFNMKGIFVYPLVSRDKVIGILEYTSIKKREDLSPFEFTIMQEFVSEAGRALENALLYQDLKYTSRKLEVANIKLKELDHLKDDFVSIASHELRTPMTAIRSYAWMALHKSDAPLSDKLQKYLERTLISTERLINLVNDMLNVSRIESGRIEIAPQAFDIQNLVGEVLVEIDAKAKEKNLQIEVVGAVVPKVFADPNKTHQILLNLLGNALKFTQENGKIIVSYFSDGKNLQVSISDNGVGISKENLSRLFRKFSRLEDSYIAASSTGGTGLGLFISKSLVELMKGSINVRSEGEGRGATFTFSLPVATTELLGKAEKYHYSPEGEVKLLEPVAIQAYPNEPSDIIFRTENQPAEI